MHYDAIYLTVGIISLLLLLLLLLLFFLILSADVLFTLWNRHRKIEANPDRAGPSCSEQTFDPFVLGWKSGSIRGPDWGKAGSVSGGGKAGRFDPPGVLYPIEEEMEGWSGSNETSGDVVGLETFSTPRGSPPFYTPSPSPARMAVEDCVTVACEMESKIP
ncbi:hypothetical protein MRB53_023851 [Persea americana]|uniref:Uncharacterized protein n=1 Tax=Persea americana TaxID=3435 RepID=A0ACC2LBJ4_PERAE|nr:hypothetical protein MRB53_023851 [Persea americana]